MTYEKRSYSQLVILHNYATRSYRESCISAQTDETLYFAVRERRIYLEEISKQLRAAQSEE